MKKKNKKKEVKVIQSRYMQMFEKKDEEGRTEKDKGNSLI